MDDDFFFNDDLVADLDILGTDEFLAEFDPNTSVPASTSAPTAPETQPGPPPPNNPPAQKAEKKNPMKRLKSGTASDEADPLVAQVEEYMKVNNISQPKLAKLIGVPAKSFSNFLSKKGLYQPQYRKKVEDWMAGCTSATASSIPPGAMQVKGGFGISTQQQSAMYREDSFTAGGYMGGSMDNNSFNFGDPLYEQKGIPENTAPPPPQKKLTKRKSSSKAEPPNKQIPSSSGSNAKNGGSKAGNLKTFGSVSSNISLSSIDFERQGDGLAGPTLAATNTSSVSSAGSRGLPPLSATVSAPSTASAAPSAAASGSLLRRQSSKAKRKVTRKPSSSAKGAGSAPPSGAGPVATGNGPSLPKDPTSAVAQQHGMGQTTAPPQAYVTNAYDNSVSGGMPPPMRGSNYADQQHVSGYNGEYYDSQNYYPKQAWPGQGKPGTAASNQQMRSANHTYYDPNQPSPYYDQSYYYGSESQPSQQQAPIASTQSQQISSYPSSQSIATSLPSHGYSSSMGYGPGNSNAPTQPGSTYYPQSGYGSNAGSAPSQGTSAMNTPYPNRYPESSYQPSGGEIPTNYTSQTAKNPPESKTAPSNTVPPSQGHSYRSTMPPSGRGPPARAPPPSQTRNERVERINILRSIVKRDSPQSLHAQIDETFDKMQSYPNNTELERIRTICGNEIFSRAWEEFRFLPRYQRGASLKSQMDQRYLPQGQQPPNQPGGAAPPVSPIQGGGMPPRGHPGPPSGSRPDPSKEAMMYNRPSTVAGQPTSSGTPYQPSSDNRARDAETIKSWNHACHCQVDNCPWPRCSQLKAYVQHMRTMSETKNAQQPCKPDCNACKFYMKLVKISEEKSRHGPPPPGSNTTAPPSSQQPRGYWGGAVPPSSSGGASGGSGSYPTQQGGSQPTPQQRQASFSRQPSSSGAANYQHPSTTMQYQGVKEESPYPQGSTAYPSNPGYNQHPLTRNPYGSRPPPPPGYGGAGQGAGPSSGYNAGQQQNPTNPQPGPYPAAPRRQPSSSRPMPTPRDPYSSGYDSNYSSNYQPGPQSSTESSGGNGSHGANSGGQGASTAAPSSGAPSSYGAYASTRGGGANPGNTNSGLPVAGKAAESGRPPSATNTAYSKGAYPPSNTQPPGYPPHTQQRAQQPPRGNTGYQGNTPSYPPNPASQSGQTEQAPSSRGSQAGYGGGPPPGYGNGNSIQSRAAPYGNANIKSGDTNAPRLKQEDRNPQNNLAPTYSHPMAGDPAMKQDRPHGYSHPVGDGRQGYDSQRGNGNSGNGGGSTSGPSSGSTARYHQSNNPGTGGSGSQYGSSTADGSTSGSYNNRGAAHASSSQARFGQSDIDSTYSQYGRSGSDYPSQYNSSTPSYNGMSDKYVDYSGGSMYSGDVYQPSDHQAYGNFGVRDGYGYGSQIAAETSPNVSTVSAVRLKQQASAAVMKQESIDLTDDADHHQMGYRSSSGPSGGSGHVVGGLTMKNGKRGPVIDDQSGLPEHKRRKTFETLDSHVKKEDSKQLTPSPIKDPNDDIREKDCTGVIKTDDTSKSKQVYEGNCKEETASTMVVKFDSQQSSANLTPLPAPSSMGEGTDNRGSDIHTSGGDISGGADRLFCVVCRDAERAMLFEPCNHLACCKKCGGNMDSCPICRTVISGHKDIYVP